METLGAIMPDVQVLLAMAPEDLAPMLLRLARLHSQGGMFHPNNMERSVLPSSRQRPNEVAQFIAVWSASTLAGARCISSPFSSQSHEKRRVS